MRVALSCHLRIHLNPFQLWTVTGKQDLTLLFTFNCTFLPPPCSRSLLCSRANNFFHLITKFVGNLEVYLWARSVDGLMQSTLRSYDYHTQNHQCSNTQSGGNHSPVLSAEVNSCPRLHEIAPSVSTTIRFADWPKGYPTLLDSPFKDVLKTITVTLGQRERLSTILNL